MRICSVDDACMHIGSYNMDFLRTPTYDDNVTSSIDDVLSGCLNLLELSGYS